ncbi:NERD domain-containing protein [Ralstonia pseudosolanacearum]
MIDKRTPETPVSGVEIYLGHAIEEPTELRLLNRLRADLEAKAQSCIVFANFYVGHARTQVDFVVATEKGATVIEVKGYRYPVEGGVNGAWQSKLDETRRRRISSKNPFQQAIDARYAIADEVSTQFVIDSVRSRQAIGGNLCLFPAPLLSSNIPEGNFKCTIGGYRELLEQIEEPRVGALPLSLWREFAQKLGLMPYVQDGPNADERFVADYSTQWEATVVAANRPFVSPSLECGGHEFTLPNGIERLREGASLFLVGSSGSGKTRILEELSTLAGLSGMFPIAIEARVFEGDMRSLLERSIVLATKHSLPEVLRVARRSACPLVIFVDGFNECPPAHQKTLVRSLLALHRRHSAQFVLSGQSDFAVPWGPSDHVTVLDPSQEHLKAVLEAHLGREATQPERDALEVVTTANDAAILADVVLDASRLDGRFALYSAFTRQRLGSGEAESHRALSELAMWMRERLTSTVAEHELLRELAHVLGSSTAASQLSENAQRCGLLVRRVGKVFFRHDLIADYFSAEALLVRHLPASALNQALQRPIYASLAHFAVGGSDSVEYLGVLLREPTHELLVACLEGKCGSSAKSFVADRMRDLLEKVADRYEALVLELETDEKGRHIIRPDLPERNDFDLSKRYLSVAPAAALHGLLPEVLEAFHRIDGRIFAQAEQLRTTHADKKLAFRKRAFNAVYSSPGVFLAREMFDVQQAFQSYWPKSTPAAAVTVLQNALSTPKSFTPGQLLVVISAYKCLSRTQDTLPDGFAKVADYLWNIGFHPLRMTLVDLVRGVGWRLAPDVQEELGNTLHSWLSDSDPITNSLVFDALGAVGGIESGLSVESVFQEYVDVLNMPRSKLAAERAMHLYVCTFDHPCAPLYWEAYQERLCDAQRQELLIRALDAEFSDLTTPWIIHELAKNPHPDAIPKLQQFVRPPSFEGTSPQGAVEAFLNAIVALAKLGVHLQLHDAESVEEAAWNRAAQILHAIVHDGEIASAQEYEIEALWKQLEQCGTASALDVVMWVEKNHSFTSSNSRTSFLPACARGVRKLAQIALQKEYSPTSLVPKQRRWGDLAAEHRTFALSVLREYGRKTDLELVRQWIEDAVLGQYAIETAKTLEAAP